jgi:hypothetical protein
VKDHPQKMCTDCRVGAWGAFSLLQWDLLLFGTTTTVVQCGTSVILV